MVCSHRGYDEALLAEFQEVMSADRSGVLRRLILQGLSEWRRGRALIVVARSHGVECDWVTTLLLRCTASGVLDANEARDVLYELVDSGMPLDPRVHARIQDRLDDLA